ncbi:AMP-binding protein [Bradyrhizobium sp. CSA207]|uniref:class I adenylate-forming enzyme family protein n=1 Tax=Bradyrhizobium sp. CSA207 TaxID=2698826 RepID=UPI0023B167A4|nr:AMP-binding protein [Bradyrhizobium sp. CSA207]MDE5445812.1 AMP-binding protein [Bradyrhizobium sp. CSA207]
MRLENILFAQAQRYPDKVALVCGAKRVTYRDLAQRVRKVANGLQSRGVKQGDRIVLFVANGIDLVELLYATFAIGAVVVPVTTRLTPHELSHICGDSRPAAIVFEGDGEKIAEVLRENATAIQVSIDHASRSIVAYADIGVDGPVDLPKLSVEIDDAAIMYTSGTTGKPKGAIITHSNIVVQNYFIHAVEWAISSEDRYLVTTPLAHRAGFARMANSLSLGGTLVVLKNFDPEEAVATIEREQITVAGVVPTICRMMLPVVEAGSERCKTLKLVVVTGEAFPVELKRRMALALPDLKMVSFFAMTEAGAVTSLSHEEQLEQPTSIGRPTPGVEVRIINEAGVDCGTDDPGELLVRAGEPGRFTTMRGYFNLPEATAEIIRDGWLHTGDVATRDASGYLYIVDRKKDMILSGGLNIYTKEVEQALLSHPDIADVAIIGVPDEKFGEAVAAFVQPDVSAALTTDMVRDHAGQLLAGYKKPRYVYFVDVLPRNSLGKVLKGDLRRQAAELQRVPPLNDRAEDSPVERE